MPDSTQHPPMAFTDRYDVIRELGRGGSSTVYLASDRNVEGQLVALKWLNEDMTFHLGMERFSREIKVMALLQHPNILSILDSGRSGDRLFLVMPYVEGETLRDRLMRERQLPVADALRIAADLCDALAYAHAKGVVHRDVKPENILLGPRGRAWLTDFGIARGFDPTLFERITTSGMVPGTPAYASPEQVAGEPNVDGRSDVYSLGCVLYECLAGVPPFVGPDPLSTARMRLVVDPVPLRAIRDGVPEHLCIAISRAMARNPADRFASSAEFAEYFQRTPSADLPAITGDGTSGTRVRRRVAQWSGVAAIATAAAVWAMSDGIRECAGETVDPQRVAVFSFDDDTGIRSSGMTGETAARLLRSALLRWSGLPSASDEELRVAELALRPTNRSLDRFACSAARMGAGRFVRGNLTRVGDSISVRATLFGAVNGRSLRQAMQTVGAVEQAPSASLAELAIALFRPEGEPRDAWYADTLARSYDTWQAFGRARALIDAGAVDSAERLLSGIAAREAHFAPAQAWLAQVMSWRDSKRVEGWRAAAVRALRPGGILSKRDRLLASALAALADSKSEEACGAYGDMLAIDSADFVAWYGEGWCRFTDSLVMRNENSPSGWQFRSSFAEAADRFERALDYAPAAFAPFVMRRAADAAPVRPMLRYGWNPAHGSTSDFAALPGVVRGRLAHVPLSRERVERSARGTVPATLGEALALSRKRSLRMSERWVRRFPESGEAHAARGRALELQALLLPDADSQPSADGELQQAIALIDDDYRRVELRVDRVRVAAKAGRIALVNAIADSLLSGHLPGVRGHEGLLAGVAILVGRAERAADLLESSWRQESAAGGDGVATGSAVLASASRFLVLSALGVCGDTLRVLQRALETYAAGTLRGSDGAVFREQFVNRPLSLSASCESFAPSHEVASDADFLVRAQRHMARRRPALARATLDSMERQRIVVMRSEVALDYLVQESILRLAMGDSVRAVTDLVSAVDGLVGSAAFTMEQLPQAGAIPRALALLNRHDPDRSRRLQRDWAGKLRQLFAKADPIVITWNLPNAVP